MRSLRGPVLLALLLRVGLLPFLATGSSAHAVTRTPTLIEPGLPASFWVLLAILAVAAGLRAVRHAGADKLGAAMAGSIVGIVALSLAPFLVDLAAAGLGVGGDRALHDGQLARLGNGVLLPLLAALGWIGGELATRDLLSARQGLPQLSSRDSRPVAPSVVRPMSNDATNSRGYYVTTGTEDLLRRRGIRRRLALVTCWVLASGILMAAPGVSFVFLAGAGLRSLLAAADRGLDSDAQAERARRRGSRRTHLPTARPR